MKNLRKFLCVVLVLCMALSLAAVASAKYTDDSSIKYTTAVGVLSGIGAIDGKPGGAFDPTGLVTRAEAAKLVAYAILGKTVAASLSTTTSSFKDVPATHWASPYIEYCASKGIINGLGDGTYNPTGNVTGFELAKLMLCAVGYGQNKEYVGANWSINVASDALNYGIFTGNESATFSAPATREEAALYIFNGLLVPQVQYNSLFGYYGKGTSVTAPGVGSTIASDVYKMSGTDVVDGAFTGIVIGGSVTSVTATGTDICQATISSDTGKVTAISAAFRNFKFDAKAADMGQLIAVYANSVTGKVYYTETLSKTVANLLAASTAYAYNKLFGSSTYTTAHQIVTFSKNYLSPMLVTGAGTSDPAPITGLTVGTAAPAGNFITYGGQIIAYNNGADTTFEKVAAISTTTGSESISFKSGTTLSNKTGNDVIKEYEGVAIGDYVTLARCGDFFTMDKVTTVEGKISNISYFVGFKWTYTLEGKDYNAVFGVTDNSGVTAGAPSLTTDYNSNIYRLYLNSTGNVLTCEFVSGASASSVVYVTSGAWDAPGDYGTVFKFQAVNTAGEAVIYTTATANDSRTVGAQPIAAGFYKVTVDATTKLANIVPATAADEFIPSAGIKLVKGTITDQTDVDGNVYYYTADTKFIFVSNDGPTPATLKITKVTGIANVVDVQLTTNDGLFFNETTSKNKTINTVIVRDAFDGASNAKVMYVAKEDPQGSDTTGFTKNVYIDGVQTKIKFSNASLDSYKGRYVTYVVNSDNVYTVTGFNDTNTGNDLVINKTTGIFGNNVTIDGVTMNATGAVIVDLSQPTGDPAVYTSLAAMAAANRFFKVDYSKNTDGIVTTIYVNEAYAFSANPAATIVNDATSGLTATTKSVTVSGNVATYTINISGVAANTTNITITNGTGPAAGSFWPIMTMTDSTHYSFAAGTDITTQATAYGMTGYYLTVTVTLTADNTPVPTITFDDGVA